MSGAIVVVAVATPRAGRIDDVEAVLRVEIPAVHHESGCETYALHRTLDGERVVMIERWADDRSLSAHGAGEPMARIIDGLKDLLAAPLDITRMAPVPEGTREKGQL